MKNICLSCAFIISLLSCFLLKTAYAGQHEFHFSNEFSLTYNNISGPGHSQSSLTEGVNYLNDLGLFGNGKLGEFDYNFNLGGKATDDRRMDPKTFSLTNLQGRITNKIHTMTLGDTFESFSQYSLSTAVKGGSYKFHNESSSLPEIILIYGIAAPRWDSVWRDYRTKTIERQVYGSRIKYNFTPLFYAGFSLVRSQDDKRINTTDPLYTNNIYSLDAEYKPIPGLILYSEYAFNNTQLSKQQGTDYAKSDGYAFKITATGDGHPSRVTLEYERISPDFITLLGAATADREKIKAKWRYKWTKIISLNTGFLWYRNDLEGQRSDGRTDYYKPEAGVTVNKLFGRQYSVTDISYKLNVAEKDSSNIKTDHIVNLNYRDRFGIFDSDTNLGYTNYAARGTSRQKSNEYIYNTSLNSRHTVGVFILKPALYLGGWEAQDELSDTKDMIYEYSLGIGIDVPSLKITSNIKVGENKLDKETPGTDDSRKAFANINIYYKPKFLEKLNNGMLFLRTYVNDFRYTTGVRNFRDTSITAGLNIQM